MLFRSVVAHYNDEFVQRPSTSADMLKLNLTDEEQTALVEFMKTLSSMDKPIALPSLPAYDQTAEGAHAGFSPASGPKKGGSQSGQSQQQCGAGLFHHWQGCTQ